ncbi:MAG: sigma 54-interacting transcriptional regulator [Calditrichaeota bacterium]|nr:sigma 54-interacting transcriptional regulator [Calditrichota bacterium]MCB9366750.1 sigma 54-interacting transcriptional regulator [Calditrichota bacterium]
MSSQPALQREQLQALYDISQVLNTIWDIDNLLERIMDIALQTVSAERGFLVLREEGDGNKLSVRTAREIAPEAALSVTEISSSIVTGAIESQQGVLTVDAQTDPRFAGAESVIFHQIRAVMAVPFVLRGKIVGAIYLDSRKNREGFTDESLAFLKAFSNLCAIAIENARLMGSLRDENYQLRSEVQRTYQFKEIIGNSSKMQEIFELLNKIIHADISVLLEGESGTGKELVARALHYNGPRRDKAFMAQFCGNLSETLLESELFGHKRGAFTGAVSDKKGLLEIADGGTFFLDEIADIPASIQAKLLRFLQDGEFRRVGDTETRRVNVRVISATNKPLAKEVEKGNFREDLFYRLNVITINMPPLRDRDGDLPLLVRHFLQKYSQKTSTPEKRITSEAMRMLSNYHWPGNVRELENAVERAIVLAGDRDLSPEELIIPRVVKAPGGSRSLREHEREYVLRTLEEMGGNKTKTAAALGVSLRWLHYKLAEWKEAGN